MGYEIDWFQHPHLIRITFHGYLSLEDYEQSDQEIMMLLRPMEPPVYVLMDMSAVASFPMSLYQMQIRMRAWRLPAYSGMIAYQTKPIMNVMIRSLNRLMGVPFLHARSLEAALSMIKHLQPDLRPYLRHIQTQELPALQLLEHQYHQHERLIIAQETAEVRHQKYNSQELPSLLPMIAPSRALLVLPDPGLALLDHFPTPVLLPQRQNFLEEALV